MILRRGASPSRPAACTLLKYESGKMPRSQAVWKTLTRRRHRTCTPQQHSIDIYQDGCLSAIIQGRSRTSSRDSVDVISACCCACACACTRLAASALLAPMPAALCRTRGKGMIYLRIL